MNEIYKKLFENIRAKKPLIHHITNYVTANDCANITLAVGASPVMADDIAEVSDICAISSALLINMGTLNAHTIESMLTAGKTANRLNIPVVFDPVGVGASSLRNKTARKFLNEIKVSVLRGNISEIKFIAGLQSETKGVDASNRDLTDDTIPIAKNLSKKLDCVVAITGAVDIISNGEKNVSIKNGHKMLSNITGTGCMCSSLIASFCGASPKNIFESAITAISIMGIAGEIAFSKSGGNGNGSFRTALHDAVSKINAEIFKERVKIYEE